MSSVFEGELQKSASLFSMGHALRTLRTPSRREDPVESLNEDLWFAILNQVSVNQGNLSHIRACRAWVRLGLQAQARLELPEDARVPEDSLTMLLQSLPALRSLHARNRSLLQISDRLLSLLPTLCPQLRQLRIGQAESTEATFAGLLQCLLGLPCLQVLVLEGQNNGVPGPFHMHGALCELRHLRQLHVDTVLDSISDAASRLTSLKDLNIRACSMQAFDSILRHLPHLHSFTMRTCPWAMELPIALAGMSSLHELSLCSSETVSFPGMACRLPSICILRLTCHTCPQLPLAPNLRILNLTVHQGNTAPQGMEALTNLRVLKLTQEHLTALPAGLAHVSRLEDVRLKCSRLESLPQQDSKSAPPKCLKKLLIHSKHLKSLTGSFCWSSTLEAVDLRVDCMQDWPPAMFENFSSLRSLRIYSHFLKTLPSSIGTAASLKSLEIDAVSLATLPTELGLLGDLRVLKLKCCKVESLAPFLQNLRKLEELYLTIMMFLSSLGDSLACLTNLSSITLERCPALTKLPQDTKNIPKLRKLIMKRCALGALPFTAADISHLDIVEIACKGLSSISWERQGIMS